MSLFWSKNALFWSEIHHMLSYSVVLYCIVFLLHCLVYILLPYGIAWYCIVWFGILCYLFCILLRFLLCRTGFVSQDAYSLHPPIQLSPPISDSFGSSGSADPSEWIHPSGSAHQSGSFWSSGSSSLIHPSGLLFVICHWSLVICHLVFFICHLFICYLLHCCLLHCLVYILLPYGITWYCIVWFGILYYLFCMLLRFSLRRAGCVSQDAYSLNCLSQTWGPNLPPTHSIYGWEVSTLIWNLISYFDGCQT